MKSKEFHKKITQNGWVLIRSSGSHYTYEKDGVKVTVPFHGAKEVREGLRKKIEKEMGLK